MRPDPHDVFREIVHMLETGRRWGDRLSQLCGIATVVVWVLFDTWAGVALGVLFIVVCALRIAADVAARWLAMVIDGVVPVRRDTTG